MMSNDQVIVAVALGIIVVFLMLVAFDVRDWDGDV
jgi:hypothetical protein